MSSKGFESLRVYKLAETLADHIWKMVQQWAILARDTIGKQIIRAADSIGPNIAEGVGRGTYLDNRRFVRIARGSLYETRHWLRRAYQRKLVTPNETALMKPLLDSLGPQLNAYLKSIGPQTAPVSRTDD